MSGFFVVPGDDDEDLPPVVKEHFDRVRRIYDERTMFNEAFAQELYDLFLALNPEQLATLRLLFHTISTHPTPRPIASHHEGVCAAILRVQHNVCPGCGKDHAAELLEDAITDEVAPKEGDQ